ALPPCQQPRRATPHIRFAAPAELERRRGRQCVLAWEAPRDLAGTASRAMHLRIPLNPTSWFARRLAPALCDQLHGLSNQTPANRSSPKLLAPALLVSHRPEWNRSPTAQSTTS